MDDRFGFLRAPPPESDPVEASFYHRLPGSEGEVALQYWPPVRGTHKPPEHIIVFVLGNPGLLNYYHTFLTQLHHLLPPSHAVLSTSHIGHSPHLPAPKQPLDLHQQLAAKVELLTALRSYTDAWAREGYRNRRSGAAEMVDQARISLMGHSVGSWLILEMIKCLKFDVEAGYMLFPTLGWIADSWNGWKLWPIFHRPVKQLLPYVSYIFRPILSFTSFPATTLSLLRSPRTIAHCLHLSRSEMYSILAPDLTSIQHLSSPEVPEGRGLYGIWAGGGSDGWVGREGKMVRDVMGGPGEGRVVEVQGIQHAFCLSDYHSRFVAERVAEWIDPSLAERRNNFEEAEVVDMLAEL